MRKQQEVVAMNKLVVQLSGLVVLGGGAWAQVTQRVSVDTVGMQANAAASFGSISTDGRYVAFTSSATNLVPGDTNARTDVFVRDRLTGSTERVSVDSVGTQGDQDSYDPHVSSDGRYVTFASAATNLVPGDTNARADVFVRDRQSGITERVSLSAGGSEGNGDSSYPSISSDGRIVAFRSAATDLVPGDTNGFLDIFVRDRQLAATERVNVATDGSQANADSFTPDVSADGRYVAFVSFASNLDPVDGDFTVDVFVRDRQSATTEVVSLNSSGQSGGGVQASISADGRYVAFQAYALVPQDTNARDDIYVRDRQTATTERVSLGQAGAQGNEDSDLPSISADGRYVAFASLATNLVPGDTNASSDVFVHDRQTGATELASLGWDGTQGGNTSDLCDVSGDGRYVAFESRASDLVPTDTNGAADIFVRDRIGGSSFTSLCDPGAAGVLSCPCSNPPSGSGRGCDNSSSTGGAVLSASGGTYLSSDSLVFSTSGEKPTALSIVLQGNALLSSGTVFGQGVRCAGGALKRLFVKTASGGGITAPNFVGGDASVSAQSAAKGDPILAGQSRWYLVYYRDPIVLGGCPATSTFNATQTGQVSWAP